MELKIDKVTDMKKTAPKYHRLRLAIFCDNRVFMSVRCNSVHLILDFISFSK